MSEQDCIDRIRRANEEMFVRKNFDAADELFAPEYVAHLTEEDLRGNGPEIIRDLAEQFAEAFPDLEIDVEILAATGDRVAWVRTHTGTHERDFMGVPASSRRFTWKDMIVTRFEDDKIAEEWAVSDLRAQAQA